MPKKELHFSIEGTTPHTFPMARLADYLRELATLLGNEDNAMMAARIVLWKSTLKSSRLSPNECGKHRMVSSVQSDSPVPR